MAYFDSSSQVLDEPSTNSLDSLIHGMKETTFDAKNNFFSYRKAYNLRSEKCKLKPNENKPAKTDAEFDIWKLKPLDFNWKLYCQPHPPKKYNFAREISPSNLIRLAWNWRNTREAIKPWRYHSQSESTQVFPNTGSKIIRLPLKIVDDFNYYSATDHKKVQTFRPSVRQLSPLSAKIQAAKSMSYREGLGPYASKSTPIFRNVLFYGLNFFSGRKRIPKKFFFYQAWFAWKTRLAGFQNTVRTWSL